MAAVCVCVCVCVKKSTLGDNGIPVLVCGKPLMFKKAKRGRRGGGEESVVLKRELIAEALLESIGVCGQLVGYLQACACVCVCGCLCLYLCVSQVCERQMWASDRTVENIFFVVFAN